MAIAATTCAACPAYNPSTKSTGIGECRATVPTTLGDTLTVNATKNATWPIVASADWCVFGRVMTALNDWPAGGP